MPRARYLRRTPGRCPQTALHRGSSNDREDAAAVEGTEDGGELGRGDEHFDPRSVTHAEAADVSGDVGHGCRTHDLFRLGALVIESVRLGLSPDIDETAGVDDGGHGPGDVDCHDPAVEFSEWGQHRSRQKFTFGDDRPHARVLRQLGLRGQVLVADVGKIHLGHRQVLGAEHLTGDQRIRAGPDPCRGVRRIDEQIRRGDRDDNEHSTDEQSGIRPLRPTDSFRELHCFSSFAEIPMTGIGSE